MRLHVGSHAARTRNRRVALLAQRIAVLGAEIRLGWLQAVNVQGSGGLAKLGSIVAVVLAAFTGTHLVGTLIAVYLLAQRVFWGFDGLIDLSLGLQSVRGAIARCFDALTRRPNTRPGCPPSWRANRLAGACWAFPAHRSVQDCPVVERGHSRTDVVVTPSVTFWPSRPEDRVVTMWYPLSQVGFEVPHRSST